MTIQLEQMRQNATEVSAFLCALSNENRLLILCALVEGEKNVSELNSFVALSPSALSQHLSWLREGGLVQTRREAQSIYYSLADNRVAKVLVLLKKLFCSPEES
jgi:DNA-binding transcriptional ArsR family regulator